MATYYARANGNINAAIWATTPSGTAANLFPTFTSADVLMANGFGININVNTTVAEIRNDTFGGATTGGSYTFPDYIDVTLTANMIAGSNSLLNMGASIVTIIGNLIAGSSGSSIYGISMGHNMGVLIITGNITGGSGSSNNAIYASNFKNITVNGNAYGGAAGSNHAIRTALAGKADTITINGNVYGGGLNTRGIFHSSVLTCDMIINGDVYAGTAGSAHGIDIDNAYAIINTTINGNVYGGSAAVYGANINGRSTFLINGTCQAGQGGIAVYNDQGMVMVRRVVGNDYPAIGYNSVPSIFTGTQAITYAEQIQHGQYGQSPVSGAIILNDTSNNTYTLVNSTNQNKTLIDTADQAEYPDTEDVRIGVTYGYNQQTGSMIIPHQNSVEYNVGVDNTVGVAVISENSVQEGVASFESGRLNHIATVEDLGQQLALKLTGE